VRNVLRRLRRLLRREEPFPRSAEPYEPAFTAAIERVVEKGSTCADVGAHHGNITDLLVELVGKRGHVDAFEAHPDNAALLRKRFRRVRQVDVVNAAVSDGSSDRLELYAGRHDHNTEWNIVGHDVEGLPTRRVLEVRAVSLDGWYAAGKRVHFVKIDVEGAEGLVLAGMRRLLREQRPVLAVEFHDEDGWQGRRELLDAGYELRGTDGSPIDPDGPRVYHVIAVPSSPQQ
jgi:FkbM family methyltransferase